MGLLVYALLTGLVDAVDFSVYDHEPPTRGWISDYGSRIF